MADYRQEARLYKDGTDWCAVPPGFRNLAIDPAGFGATPEEAVADLQRWIAADLSVSDFVRGGYCKSCLEWWPEAEFDHSCGAKLTAQEDSNG